MYEYHSISGSTVEVDFKDLPQVLANFRRDLTGKGFSDDQAFQLALELLRKMVISAGGEEVGEEG